MALNPPPLFNRRVFNPKLYFQWPWKKLIEDGGAIPLGYGIAWPDFTDLRYRWACYPIPMNWIACWLRDLEFLLISKSDKAFNRRWFGVRTEYERQFFYWLKEQKKNAGN